MNRDPREPAVVELDGGATVHVDRYTGERLGDGDTRTRRFLRGVLNWHRWFALEGEHRIIGRTIMATANLGFLFLLVSGVYLWWPRTGGRAAWRRALWFRRGLGGRARDFNWHNVIGFWSAVPLAVIVASGATISYQWAADLVHRLAGDAPPFQASPRSSASIAQRDPFAPPDAATPPIELQVLVARAAAETPGWRTMTVRLPESTRDAVVVGVDRGTGRQPSRSEDLLFDRATGELIERAGYPTFSRGFKIRRWLRFAHTGEVYGAIGQSIAGVVSLGVAVMVWTGLAMSWRRWASLAGGEHRAHRRCGRPARRLPVLLDTARTEKLERTLVAGAQRALFVPRLAVVLGGDDGDRRTEPEEPRQRRAVVLQAGVPAVDDEDRSRQPGLTRSAIGLRIQYQAAEEALRQRIELASRRLAAPREPVPREVGQREAPRPRTGRRGARRVEVHHPRGPRPGAGARDAPPGQRVDEAGLADVRPADHRDDRRGGGRQPTTGRQAGDEPGVLDPHGRSAPRPALPRPWCRDQWVMRPSEATSGDSAVGVIGTGCWASAILSTSSIVSTM